MKREARLDPDYPMSTPTEQISSVEKFQITLLPQDSLTPKEVAAILRINPGTVYNWIYAGKLPSLKFGRLRRIKAEVVRKIQDQGLE